MTEQEVKELLKNNLNKVFVFRFFKNEKLDEEILEKYVGYFDPLYQFEKIVLEKSPEKWWIEFVENELDIQYLWTCISSNQKLSESFIDRHSKEVDWYFISIYQKLSEEFIEKHSKKVNWNMISQYQKLSEEFIEKYSDKICWESVSIYQKLSESFIERHSDKVNLIYVSNSQDLKELFRLIE